MMGTSVAVSCRIAMDGAIEAIRTISSAGYGNFLKKYQMNYSSNIQQLAKS
jgi:hypothetical protein